MARRIGFALLALLVALGGALAWRLDKGPVRVPFLAAWIESAGESASRIEIGAAHLGWRGWRDGRPASPDILLSNIRAFDPSGAQILEIPEATITVRLRRLLLAEIAPRHIVLREPRIRVLRSDDGNFRFGLDMPGANQDGGPLDTMRRLESLAVRNGVLHVEDRQLGQSWGGRQFSLLARRQDEGPLQGQASAEFVLGGASMPVRMAARLEEAPFRLRLALDIPPLNPAELARTEPALAPLGRLDALASLSATLTLDEQAQPLGATAQIQAGPGQIGFPEEASMPFQALRLSLAAEERAVRLEALDLQLAAPPDTAATGPRLTAAGHARLTGGMWQAEAELGLDHAALGELELWWPPTLAPSARAWVTDSLVAGVLHDGRWQLRATASRELDEVALADLSGEARLAGLAIAWTPGLPPVEGMDGRAVFAPDSVVLEVEGGRQAGTALQLPRGQLRLTGLGAAPARAELRGSILGPASDLWDVLRHPALGWIEQGETPIRNPTGNVVGEIAATVPLAGPRVAAEPLLQAEGRLTQLRLPDLVLGRTLDDGTFDVRVDADGLRATGNAQLAGLPLRAEVAMDWSGPLADDPALNVDATTRAPAARLAEFGLDPGEALQGPLGLVLRYHQGGGRPERLDLRADLTGVRIFVPPVYAKPPGTPATLQAGLRLQDGVVSAIESLRAEGPDLLLRGRATAGAGHPIGDLQILEGRIGATRFTGTVAQPEAPGGAWRASLHGPLIDLRPLIANATGGGAGVSGQAAPMLVLDARFDRALVPGQAGPLQDMVASATLSADVSLLEASINAGLGEAPDAPRFAASVEPRQDGSRAMRVDSEDAGSLLSALGLDLVEGGSLTVTATQGVAPGAPISGTARMTEFTVARVPGAAEAGTAGIAEGMGFTQLVAPFRLEGSVLVLQDARAFSPALGITARGRVDLSEETLDLQGTIVPAHIFNSLLGHLPIIGRLFSPEPGGGVFSAAFRATGPLADPEVNINPLTALTPGFLRGLFELGEEAAPAEAEGAQAP